MMDAIILCLIVMSDPLLEAKRASTLSCVNFQSGELWGRDRL